MNEKEFERNICFTFFEDYRKTAKEIEEDYGKDAVADYYNAIIDYALYEIEPELKGILKYTWYTTQTTIDKSVQRRSSGFGKEDTEKTAAILKYKAEHPEATQREIAKAVNASPGKVNKVLNNISSSDTFTNTFTNATSSTNTSNEHEREHNSCSYGNTVKGQQRDLEELSDEELELIISDYKKRIDYKATREKLNLNRQVSKETHIEAKELLEKRKREEKERKMTAQLSAISDTDLAKIIEYLNCESNAVASNLSYLGVTADYFLKWLNTHHSVYFSLNGEGWKERKDEYKTYIDFLKMGIEFNPVDGNKGSF